MKKKSTLLKELRKELRYWQGVYRIEARSLGRTKEKIKEIAAKMRKVQET